MESSDENEQVLDALWRAAREAAELPLSAEEDGPAYARYVIDGALDALARAGVFPEPARVRAAFERLSGYQA